jgi:hypothetical protein
MGRVGRYNDEISHTRPRADTPSRPHGSPLHSTKPSSSVQTAAGGEKPRAHVRGRLRRPEGGPRTARMKTRVITLLLAAGLLAVAALTALSMPAAAQTQTVYVKLADGSVVPVQVDVRRPHSRTTGRARAAARRRSARTPVVGLSRTPTAPASSSARSRVELRMRSPARSAAAAARPSATPTALRRRATPASSTCCPAPPRPPGSPTS